ncbi:MAG: DNA polymerase III subunit beta [Chloroflexi bacterium]|nr:DNA polymerase III subunit beta [Chloroflexota bacterium]
MRVSCLQENLAKGLSIVGRAVSHRSTLPVLGNIMFSTDRGRLRLSATNLEIGIHCWVGAKVEDEGATTVPARLLTDFVNTLPPEQIDLNLVVRTQSLNLRCARYEANIKGIDASEFPLIPTAEANGMVELELAGLRRMIDQVAFAAATDESRPTLAGVFASFRDSLFTLAATDGYRLSVRETQLAQPVPEPVSVIVPARSMMELARIIGQLPEPEEEEPATVQVTVTPAGNQILFHMPHVDLLSQLIEGTFPDYQVIIPKSHTTRTVLDTSSFLKAARVASLFARDGSNIVNLQVTPGGDVGHPTRGTVTLTATSADLGDNVSEVDALVEGADMGIAFSAKYLMDVLSVMDTEQVVLETSSATSPGVIRPVGAGRELFTHVIMPMRPH